MKPISVGVAAASVVGTIQVMSMFLPPLYEVRDPATGSQNVRGIRESVAMGGAIVVGVAALTSGITRTPQPIAGALFGVLLVGALYEWAVKNPHGKA